MNKARIRPLNEVKDVRVTGPVVYWMNRDQRLEDNWAVVYGLRLAKKYQRQFAIVVSVRADLDKHYGTRRMLDFMLTGLAELESRAKELGIGFFFFVEDPITSVPEFIKEHSVAALITDFSPLNTPQRWKSKVGGKIDVPLYEVDSHNIMPCWLASDKQEYAARTFRPRIHKHLDEYLDEFPRLEAPTKAWITPAIDWDQITKQIMVDESVKPTSFKPGQEAGYKALDDFMNQRLAGYANQRNDPSLNHLSHLSPYLHFGQLSAQRVVLELNQLDLSKHQAIARDKEVFLEELIVRRELSDNFCYYNSDYKNFKGFALWAQQTLNEHREDPREHLYSLEEFEQGQTHDEAWNAAQFEMVKTGKMHGYMRMYWAKKMLEWTESPEQALEWAIYLNDKYELDGRDPNGYVGIAWSIGGVHDRGWTERPIFGKIRYMNYNGLKRKFDIQGYIDRVSTLQ